MDGDINTPRLPSYKRKKEITDGAVTFLTFADFEDQNPEHYGLSGSATQVERIFPPEKNVQKHTITGDSTVQTDAIYQLLRSKKMV